MFNHKLPTESSGSSSSSSSSSVPSMALVMNSNSRRSASDLPKKTLEGFGVTNKDMQKAFLSLQDTHREPMIGLSCVEIPDKKALQKKCEDIISSVLAMNPSRNTLEVLLPVQLMKRHGLPHVPGDKVRGVINTRLQAWAEVLGFPADALLPLYDGDEVQLKKGNVTYHFKSWTNEYLPTSLAARIDGLVANVNSLFFKEYSWVDISKNDAGPINAIPFLTRENNDLKSILMKALTESIEDAQLVKAPNKETLEAIVNGVIFHTLLAMAHRHPELAPYAAMLSPENTKDKEAKKEINVAEIGTAMLYALNKDNSITYSLSIAAEFSHGLAYIMEEISSPAILKQLESDQKIMFYIPVKEQIRRTNPMRAMGAALKPSTVWPNLETCNSYETVEQRNEKRVEEELGKQDGKSPSPDSSSDEEQYLITVAALVGAAKRRGLMSNSSGGIDNSRVDLVFDTVERVYFPGGRSRASSDQGSSSSQSPSLNYSRNNSPPSDEEKEIKKSKTAKPGNRTTEKKD